MATSAMTPLATLTLGATQSSVTFSSISAGFRDLRLIINGTTSSSTYLNIRFNGDTSWAYRYTGIQGNGSSALANGTDYTAISLTSGANSFNASTPSISISDVMDYSATNKHKTVMNRVSSAGLSVLAMVGRWPSTSAVTSMSVFIEGGATFAIGTSFTLYGVSA